MRILLFFCCISLSFLTLSGQSGSTPDSSHTTDMVNSFILKAEKEGLKLEDKEKCTRPPGEMCKMNYHIKPEIREMRVVVVGNERTKPSFAVEDKETQKVITFTIEEEVAPDQKVNYVTKRFNLYQTDLKVVFHFGNTRSFSTEDTYMLIFTK